VSPCTRSPRRAGAFSPGPGRITVVGMAHVEVVRSDAVQRIRLNRPEKKNAVTREMYVALRAAIEEATADPGVAVLLLTGGEDFCAGNDILAFVEDGEETAEAVRAFLHALAGTDVPIVAAVTGFAVGIGTTVLMYCDVAYAASDAKFKLPFADLGLVPDAGSSYLLPMIAGRRAATELLLLGRPFGAEAAKEFGLVSEVVPPGEVLAAAEKAVAELAAKPAAAIRAAKRLLRAPHEDRLRAAIDAEIEVLKERIRSAEAQAAFAAFLGTVDPGGARSS
jgi:enoyl-CoA hydratase/carnithine racemase